MAKRQVRKYVFIPGVALSDNLYPNAYALLTANKSFIKKEATAWINQRVTEDTAENDYPNAVTLITQNKTFLKDEIVAWITAQVAANTPPFVGYTYNSTKCKRDAGYVLDAYILDLRYGGNEHTREVISKYWLGGVAQVDGDRTPEVAAHTQLKNIINNYILTKTAYASQQSPVTSTQNTSGGSAEAGAAARITTLASITTSVIANGLIDLPAVEYTSYPFANYTYNSDKCERDIGYVLDAYAHDLRYGGNRDLRDVVSFYWNGTVPQVDGNRLPESETHEYIRDLINNYIFVNDISTPLQGDVDQVVTDDDAEPQAIARITELSNITTSVIENGLDSIPVLDPGVSTIKLLGRYQQENILLITNTTTGSIIYNFSDSDLVGNVIYETERDLDFPSFLQTTDAITTVELNADTSSMASTDSIQIFVEEPELRVRPYDFGTDAIERMRIAPPQSMLDADFEYGLQPTKWQAIGMERGYPSTYEIPGTELQVSTVTTDASSGTAGIGASLITITTVSPHGLSAGTPITVKALGNSVTGFARAEGTFLVNSIVNTSQFTYYAASKVGTTPGETLATTYTQLRVGAFYTGASIGTPTFSVASNGSSGSFTTVLDTPAGKDLMTFTGTAPSIGSPLTVSGVTTGTQVTAVNGNSSGGTVTTASVVNDVANGQNTFEVDNATGIVPGLAIDDGSGSSLFVTSVVGSTITFDGYFSSDFYGDNVLYSNVSGSNLAPSGSGALFDVNRVSGAYSVTVDTAGADYAVGDRIRILGTQLGGTSPTNDLVLFIDTVNGSGGITGVSSSGVGITGDASFNNLNPVNLNGLGNGAEFDITVTAGSYSATLNSNIGGSSYKANDRIKIPGGLLGGTSPANDLTITVSTVDGSGTILTFSVAGTGTGSGSFDGISGTNLAGSGLQVNIDRVSGSYTVSINNAGSGYATNDTMTVSGILLGGATPANDATLTVTSVDLSGTVTGISVSGTGVSSDASYNAESGTNIMPVGSGATFNVTRNTGAYSVINNLEGSGYAVGDKIVINGSDLGGTSTNDLLIRITEIGGLGEVSVFLDSGTAREATSVDFVSTVTMSAITTSSIVATTSVTYGAIAEIEITFPSAHGLVPGNTINVDITSSGSNHALAEGPFFVEKVPSSTTLRYTARTTGTIATSGLTGIVYPRPDSYFVHRPYDGGVQLGTGGPQHGAQAIRQSKKYIRYQSGKGVMYTTGALFAPSYDLRSLEAEDTVIGSFITVTTDDVDHGLQVGGGIRIIGVETTGYNGYYTVADIINERVFRIQATQTLEDVSADLGPQSQISVVNWHGATVRAGAFDDQNGIFWQYDGRYLAVVRRSSTFQLAGTISLNANSNAVTGSSTRFRDQLKAGDRIVIKGMTHVVTNITSNTAMTVNPDFRGVSNITGTKLCKVQDLIIRQDEFNLDNLDGNGPSGYDLDISKMQMIGIQYSWYGAGFIDFMLRGSNGNFVFCHRIRNSNVNTEAFMRTGNMPVRYEVTNESANSSLRESITSTSTTIPLADATYFPEDGGVVYIDNELVRFTGINNDSLTGCTRAASYTNFAAGAQRNYTAGSAAAHLEGTGVVLISNTISPIISHWGSAFLTDGGFDSDRGYIFNYAATGLSVTTSRQTAFLIRLAPSVSNAIVGDLGERELLNRAQLLLQGIELTSDSGTGAIVVEGILNPQNYPSDPANIGWRGISNVASGGQPSFCQIANGGSVTWTAAAQTTFTVSTSYTNLNRTNYLYFTQAAWDASGATVGTELQDSKFPAGTRVNYVSGPFNSSGTNYRYVQFNQSSNTNIVSGTAITFLQGAPAYALPGEQVFSFVANPGERATLDLRELKELTNTTLGGRGTYPNGPDVLAVNVYKVSGTAITSNLVLRWGEAQA